MENKKVYLDNAATTFVGGDSLREMMPVFNTIYGNSNSLHSFGREALAKLDEARDRVSNALGVKSEEIYFTSGGTEANNWAIKGLARANKNKGNHIITTKIEHHSVLDSCHQLEKEGFEITYLNVDKDGLVNFSQLLASIKKTTILISIMTANNEIGTIQYLLALASVAKEKNILFHTDAVQAFGHIYLDLSKMPIDALSISSHKIYGPKGAGALYLKKGVKIEPLIIGGNQENNKRGGTVNVPAVVGFGKAAEIADRDMNINNRKLRELKEYFVSKLSENIDDITFNGHPTQRLNNIVSVSFDRVEGESILLMLDLKGIAVSTGSACTSGSLEPSYVMRALGIADEVAQGTIRFSFGKQNTRQEIDYVVECLVEIIEKLRKMSPLKKKRSK